MTANTDDLATKLEVIRLSKQLDELGSFDKIDNINLTLNAEGQPTNFSFVVKPLLIKSGKKYFNRYAKLEVMRVFVNFNNSLIDAVSFSHAEHKNIFSTGQPCWGGYRAGAWHAIHHRDLVELVNVVLLFLSHSTTDRQNSHWDYPKLKSEDKKNLTKGLF